MAEENKPKYYRPEQLKYMTKYDKQNKHRTTLTYMNWQYDLITHGAEIEGITSTQFIRQAVAEKLERMGINIKSKGENTDND